MRVTNLRRMCGHTTLDRASNQRRIGKKVHGDKSQKARKSEEYISHCLNMFIGGLRDG